jgi:hypothetical protein
MTSIKHSHMKRAMITPMRIIMLANWNEAEIHGVNSIPLQVHFKVTTVNAKCN